MNSRLAAQPASTDVKSAKADKKKNPRCVLLAGSARGGTSWALKVLDSHPAVHGSHEPFYHLTKDQALSNLYDRIKADRGGDAKRGGAGSDGGPFAGVRYDREVRRRLGVGVPANWVGQVIRALRCGD